MANISARGLLNAAATASAAAALGLAGCGGGGGGAPAVDPATQSNALVVSAPGELAAYVQARLRQRANSAATSPDVAYAPAAGAAELPRSSTLLQEAGVDEPDLLKSHGDALFSLSQRQAIGGVGAAYAELKTWRRDTAGRAQAAATLALPVDDALGAGAEGLLLAEDGRTLAVFSQRWGPYLGGGGGCSPGMACAAVLPYAVRSSVAVHRVDVSDAAAPLAGERLAIDGALVAARRVGDTLVLVTQWVPTLAPDVLPASATAAEREAAIARVAAADVLPRVRRNGGAATALLADTDCWTQPANGSTDVRVTTVTLLDLRAADLAPRSRCFVGGTQALYMTPEHLYLATTRWPVWSATLQAYPDAIRTDIHKFAFAATGVSYRASGSVPGHLGWNPADSAYRFSEWNGDLRVLSFTGNVGWATTADTGIAPSPAQLTVLRERSGDATLQPLATLPNAQRPARLGKPGEQVRAVRFVGDRGYVVTFRQVDPLYVLDLADPADPKVAGELELPGFSDRLLPMGDGLLFGVGRDVDPVSGRMAGVKVALFDVRDAAHPAVLASVTLGMAGSATAADYTPHGLGALQVDGTVRLALPMVLATSANYASWQSGLQRFEVDLAARTLRTLPMLGVVDNGGADLGQSRSLQIGPQVHHLNGAALATYDW